MQLGCIDVDDAAVEWLDDNGFDLEFDAERAEMLIEVSEPNFQPGQVLKAMAVMLALAPVAWELKATGLRLMWQ